MNSISTFVRNKLYIERLKNLADVVSLSESQVAEARDICNKKEQIEEDFYSLFTSDIEIPGTSKEDVLRLVDLFLDLYYRVRPRVKSPSPSPTPSLITVSEDRDSRLSHESLSKPDSLVCPVVMENGGEGNAPKTTPVPSVLARVEPSSTPALDSKAILPKIELPFFSGDESKSTWTNFRGLFKALVIEDTSISDLRKLHYLRTCVKGEPLRLIESLALDGRNFTIAWSTLENRYNDERRIAYQYWNDIVDHQEVARDSASLSSFLTVVTTNVNALEQLGFPTSNWSFVLVCTVLKKLDRNTREAFEAQNSRDIPTWDDLKTFLEKRVKSLKAFDLFSHREVRPKKDFKNEKHVKTSRSFLTEGDRCQMCHQATHAIHDCAKFLKLKPRERYSWVKSRQLCIRCLQGHKTPNCPHNSVCKHCSARHHDLLHFPDKERTESPQVVCGLTFPLSDKTIHVPPCQTVLLATALIDVQDALGKSHVVRALLDLGSQGSFVSNNLADRLSLRKTPSTLNIRGLSGVPVGTARYSVEVNFGPVGKAGPRYKFSAFCLDKITGTTPSSSIPAFLWEHVVGLKLADPSFGLAQPVDVLLGADVVPSLLRARKREGPPGTPTALETTLGWVLVGPVTTPVKPNETQTLINFSSFHISIEEAVHRLWDLDRIPDKSHLSPEEEFCEQLFAKEVRRTPEGRYVTPLPFRPGEPELGESKTGAKKRLISLERRLSYNPILKEKYVEFMQEYLDKEFMELVPPEEVKEHFLYLPHHGVLKEGTSASKLRIVMDASARTSNGRSLNETLIAGPKLHKDIADLLLLFRVDPVVVVADIEKMFSQILLRPEDCDYQCLLWRFDPKKEIDVYRLLRVSFGMTCSPFLAMRTLLQLASDYEHVFPQASRVLRENIFVDDILVSCPDVGSASALRLELTELLARGGFTLKKWASNCPEVLSGIPEGDKQKPSDVTFDDTSFLKILGLLWSSSLDAFTYRVCPSGNPMTKRGLLSDLARLYDPLGFLAPAILPIKLMFQELWARNVGWDDPIPSDIEKAWRNFKEEFPIFADVKIRRPLRALGENPKFIINGFADSSSKAYSACVYITPIVNGQSKTSLLLISKSRVAPSKKHVTLPRLELCAAVLLARLLNSVLNLLKDKIPIQEVFCGSDSEIVLYWIQQPPSKWQVFVANRIDIIQELTKVSWWHHVKSEENPADCATRGLTPSELVSFSLWFHGPKWLSSPRSTWPLHRPVVHRSQLEEAALEQKCQVRDNLLLVSQGESDYLMKIIASFSRLSKLLRAISYCLRFRAPKDARPSGPITTPEYRKALLCCIRVVQRAIFQDEIHRLARNKPLSGRAAHLSPFMDNDGLLRVGGRIKASMLPWEAKYPLLLPKCPLAVLIIRFYHEEFGHASLGSVQVMVQRKFWIMSARQVIRNLIFQCVSCYRTRPQFRTPLMGDLPSYRVTQVRPFSRVGVDFTGHIFIRSSTLRRYSKEKAYIAVFVCMATKAVHLEVVSNMTTEAFLAAFDRFSGRRGLPSEVYSDNGTNFVGADRELRRLFHLPHNRTLVHDKLAAKGIRWHWSPPFGPHFGGLWESSVKSTKSLLVKLSGMALMTFEELSTALVRVEACLNSRPLTAMSSDPNDLNALTPGHFLTMDAILAPPYPELEDLPINRLRRWEIVQKFHLSFWKTWHQQYIASLQSRPKWLTKVPPLKPGDLVIVKEENLPPLAWKLGRVVEIFPGSDGQVRVASVKTATYSKGEIKHQVYKRPTGRLAILPLPTGDC